MRYLLSLALLSIVLSMAAQKEHCFAFVYPLAFELSDGSTVEVGDHQAMINYKTSWKQKGEIPNLTFPIQVKWTGREAMVVESQEMLDRHMARCKKAQAAQKEHCFEFVYPLTFELSDGFTIAVSDHQAMMDYKTSWKQKGETPNLKFPIQVKWTGKEAMVVESQEMLDRHIARCKSAQARRKE